MRFSCLMVLSACACTGVVGGTPDGGGDAGPGSADAGTDAGQILADGGPDAGTPDAGSSDGGLTDAGIPDAGGPDAAVADSGWTALDSGTCTAPNPPFTASEQQLVDLPADSWFAAPSSKLRAACPVGVPNCDSVVTAWSGGAWDPVHHRMLVFGGGHGDYSGNELYAFDLATLTWSRLTEPSPASYKDQDPLPDGKPVSRHTYDGLQYLAHANRFMAHSGARWQDGNGTTLLWTFDPEATVWQNRVPANTPNLSSCCSEGSAYVAASRVVIFHLSTQLSEYDYDANQWTQLLDLGNAPYWPRYSIWGDKRGLVDTRRNLAWFLGSRLVMVWDIAAKQPATDNWVTTGGSAFTNAADVSSYPDQVFNTTGGEVITAQAPGADYDPVADDIVAWVGGGPWVLDLDTRVWTRGSSTGAPTTPSQHGTYGRWRYVERTNVFILVNDVDQDVLFYKHTPRCGQ